MSVLEQAVPTGYRYTEIGILPKEWEIKSGVELTELIAKGASPKWQGFQYSSDGMLFVTSENVREGYLDITEPKYLPLEFHEKIKRSKLKKMDILINLVGGSIGRSCQILTELGEANINQAVAIFRVKAPFDSRYISIYFQSNSCIERILDMQVDAARPNVSLTDLRNFLIPIPTSKEQTVIANALSDVDALLTELEKLIAKKQAIKTATMQQLLTGKTRLPQFATYTEGEKQGQPKGTKPSELGEIPDDWDVVTLNDIAEKIMVGIASAATHAYRDRGIAFLRNQNILPNKLDEKDTLFISPEYEVAFQNKRLKTGDLLTARTGYPGTTCIVPEQFNGAQSFTTLITRLKKSISNPMYVSAYMNSEAGEKFFELNQIGGGQKNVNSAILKTLPLPFPCIKEQTAIATILSDMDNEIQTLEQRLTKTRQIKQGMMQELLTGRTRLPFDKNKEA